MFLVHVPSLHVPRFHVYQVSMYPVSMYTEFPCIPSFHIPSFLSVVSLKCYPDAMFQPLDMNHDDVLAKTRHQTQIPIKKLLYIITGLKLH